MAPASLMEKVHEDPDFYRGGVYAPGMYAFWSAALRRFYELLPRGGSLLDVGAGAGDLVGWALTDGRQAQGVEPFWPTLAPGVIRGFGENLPLGDDSFDLVTCFSVLQDVEDPDRCLDEMRRVAKIGGIIALAVPLPYPLMLHRYRNAPDSLLARVPSGLVSVRRDYVGIRYVVPVIKRSLAGISSSVAAALGRLYLHPAPRVAADMAIVFFKRVS